MLAQIKAISQIQKALMSTSSRKYTLVSFVFALLIAPTLVAQTPSPNADILKMIQAGLPENSVVAKIHENAGHWDTSVDALIALKQAGATSAEIQALTDSLAAPQATAPAAPIIVAGGMLLRTKEGDPYIQFPQRVATVFPDFEPSNIARLISYDGKPAIRVPAEHMSGDLSPGAGNTSGNLIITHDLVLFDPYLREDGWGFYPKNGKYVLDDKKIKSAQEEAFSLPRTAINLQYISLRDHVSGNPMPSDRATTFGKKNRHYDMGGYEVGFHYTGVNRNHDINEQVPCKVTADCASPELEAFVRDLVHNFDETIATVLSAAGITDADKQLSANAHYRLITSADFSQYAATYQAQLDHTAPPVANGGGGFFGGLSTVLQVASAGATALQQTQAGGNTIAAQQAAMAQYNQNVATILSGNGSAPVPGTTSAADTAGGSSSSGVSPGGGLYNGPNAEWVRKLLSTAGPYSCAPVKAPSHPNTFACSGRDGYVYGAQQLAWAAECSAQTGHMQDATADANALLDTLKNAGDLCQAQSMATSCTTDRIISCSQLPHH